jgi:hypothetical protein
MQGSRDARCYFRDRWPFGRFVKSEIAKLEQVIKTSGTKVD